MLRDHDRQWIGPACARLGAAPGSAVPRLAHSEWWEHRRLPVSGLLDLDLDVDAGGQIEALE